MKPPQAHLFYFLYQPEKYWVSLWHFQTKQVTVSWFALVLSSSSSSPSLPCLPSYIPFPPPFSTFLSCILFTSLYITSEFLLPPVCYVLSRCLDFAYLYTHLQVCMYRLYTKVGLGDRSCYFCLSEFGSL